jgi:uncharacterized protein (TIGR00296 family)
MTISKNTATYFAYLALNKLVSALNKTPEIPKADIAKAIGYEDYNITIKAPLFVTWNIVYFNKNSDNDDEIIDHDLRGCIGNFGNLSLPKYVSEYAMIAATEDSRFSPMTQKELLKIEKHASTRDLQCSVTILDQFEDITEKPLNWTVGEHGIRISFQYRGHRHSSTFLPEVASEQEWSKQQTLDALIAKAGLRDVSFSQVQVLHIERYCGVKGSALLIRDFKSVAI